MLRLSNILDLLEESSAVVTESSRVYAVNAENAVIPLLTPITAFKSFSASGRAISCDLDESEPGPFREAAPVVCYSCRGSDFWRGRGVVVCRRCHPPVPGAEVLTFPKPAHGAAGPVEIERGARGEGAA